MLSPYDEQVMNAQVGPGLYSRLEDRDMSRTRTGHRPGARAQELRLLTYPQKQHRAFFDLDVVLL